MFPITLIPGRVLAVTHQFKGGTPKAPAPPKPPASSLAAGRTAGNMADVRKRRGYESTILTSSMGAGDENIVRKTLLGQ